MPPPPPPHLLPSSHPPSISSRRLSAPFLHQLPSLHPFSAVTHPPTHPSALLLSAPPPPLVFFFGEAIRRQEGRVSGHNRGNWLFMAQFQVQIVGFPPPPPPPPPPPLLLPFHPGSLSTSHVRRLKVCHGVGEPPSQRCEVSCVRCRWNLSAEQTLHLRSLSLSLSPSPSSLCAVPDTTATEVGIRVLTPHTSSHLQPLCVSPGRQQRFGEKLML